MYRIRFATLVGLVAVLHGCVTDLHQVDETIASIELDARSQVDGRHELSAYIEFAQLPVEQRFENPKYCLQPWDIDTLSQIAYLIPFVHYDQTLTPEAISVSIYNKALDSINSLVFYRDALDDAPWGDIELETGITQAEMDCAFAFADSLASLDNPCDAWLSSGATGNGLTSRGGGATQTV